MKRAGFPIHQTFSCSCTYYSYFLQACKVLSNKPTCQTKISLFRHKKSNNSVLASDRSTNSPSVRASAPAFASLFFFWTPELETIICSLEPDQQRVAASLLGAGDGPVTDLLTLPDANTTLVGSTYYWRKLGCFNQLKIFLSQKNETGYILHQWCHLQADGAPYNLGWICLINVLESLCSIQLVQI